MVKPTKDVHGIQLWAINKWLRWTGLRLFVGVPTLEQLNRGEDGPTVLGFTWYGWGFVGNEPHSGRWHKVNGEWVSRW